MKGLLKYLVLFVAFAADWFIVWAMSMILHWINDRLVKNRRVAALSWAMASAISPGGGKAAEIAFAAPPAAIAGADSHHGLPAVLGNGDLVLYRRLVAAQQSADWQTANRLLAALHDQQLAGYLLADRYLDARYHANYGELQEWLSAYRDLAPAREIYALAQKRRSRSDPPPRRPLAGNGFSRSGDEEASWRDRPYRSVTPIAPVARKILSEAEKLAAKGETAAAMRGLARVELQTVDAVLIDRIRVDLARRLFIRNQDRDALALARIAARSADYLPEAAWLAGLSAWRIGRKGEAATFFEAVAESPAASDWTAASGAFWAGRAHREGGRVGQYDRWMQRAADFPATFYGLIARRILGRDAGFDWSLPRLGAREINRLRQFPGVTRTLALLQLERFDQAERELRRALVQVPEDLLPSLLTLAERGGMSGLAMSLGGILAKRQGLRYDAALYPLPRWRPKDGFSIDPALLFAIIRQESQFDPGARSVKGARGLMQLMPQTARLVASQRQIALKAEDLFDPTINMTLGEGLVHALLNNDAIQDNLFQLAVAYNGGSGNLAKWKRDASFHQDPLMYIETLPASESRMFVQRVLANYWIYQTRLHRSATSLDAIATHRWPVYRALGAEATELALRDGWN